MTASAPFDTAATAAIAVIRSELEDRIAGILHGCRELHGDSSRRLLLSQVERHSGVAIPIAEYPSSRQWFIGFVEACCGTPAGIRAIIAVARVFGLGPAVTVPLTCLHDEWDAAPTAVDAGEDLWARLRSELTATTRAAAVAACRLSPQAGLSLPPAHCSNGWLVLLHLAGRNAGPDGLPVYISYLEGILDQLSPETRAMVEHWNQRRAYELGLTGRLNDTRLRRGARATAARQNVHVILQFELDHLDPSTHLVSWWRQWDEESTVFERGARFVPVPPGDLEMLTEKVVTDTEALLSEREDQIILEFVLPIDLMHLPVERWPKESGSVLPKQLGCDYPVVVRSLERVHNPHWRRAWRIRWRTLHEKQDSASTWQIRDDGDGYIQRLDADLLSDENLVAAVLSGAPAPARATAAELEIVLRCGLPVILWHRDGTAAPTVSDAVKEFVDLGGPADLRARTHRLRLDAARSEVSKGDHLGHNLVILWDDPNRRPERGPDDSLSVGGEVQQ
ncbi:hypothetical protein AB1484_04940 [Parafrankia sp. FMc6]|uniref:VMAP-C domain-containing protein n=1 Tax=Parafrankia soli TaxID=2599596 RepID=UPI0034D4F31F